MKRDTLQAIAAASHCASGDADRKSIQCVRLAPTGDGLVRITATNGFLMVDRTVEDYDLFRALEDKPAYALPDTFGTISSISQDSRTPYYIQSYVINSGIDIVCGGIQIKLDRSLPGGVEYLEFDKAYPSNYNKPVMISLDAQLLLTLALTHNGHRRAHVTLEFDAENDSTAIRVYAEQEQKRYGLIGLLMPCKRISP